MQLHIIGGFLGSGKTTAIIAAARYLASQGKSVGVITNDQGKHLVDTEILKAENLPAMEVSGGCFCCHFDDLNARLKDLIELHHPDVIFAESVGSCADVVATVVRPLLELKIGALKPGSYTVFADARLLNRYLHGLEMPFSEGINYIFGKQIEEAGLLFINKTDLVDNSFIKLLKELAERSYPGKDIFAASALSATDVARWVDGLQNGMYPPPTRSLEIDYDQYAAGEGKLGWVDREYLLSAGGNQLQVMVRDILSKWALIVKDHGWINGHVKVIITGKGRSEKVSLAQSGEVISEIEIEQVQALDLILTTEVRLLLNMLVEGKPGMILKAMDEGLDEAAAKYEAEATILRSFERTPGYPQPTYRIKD